MPKALVLRLILIIAFGALYVSLRPANSSKRDDEKMKALIAQPGAMEALSWLEKAPSGSRTVGGGEKEYDHAAALGLVKELYRRGAVKVTAVRIVVDKDTAGREAQYTDTLIVELPERRESRQLLFDLDAREVQADYRPATEQGQKYFMMWWD